MEEITRMSLIFLTGLVASFIASIAGGGGLLVIPLLVVIGIPPHIAIATDRLGALGFIAGSFSRYSKERKIIWKYVTPMTVIALIAGFIGIKTLIQIEEELLTKMIALTLLVFLPMLLAQKEIGMVRINASRSKEIIGLAVYACIAFWAGLYGGGAGIFTIYALTYFLGLTMIEAQATRLIPLLLIFMLSIIIFAQNGMIIYKYSIILIISGFIGSYLGAHTAIKKGNSWVKAFFAIIIVASSVKLLFF